ncbi:MAG TPA: CBS domain-containing protein [Solirubrobacteraceae bacterium]|nr:CBS domain-containing protein [Solirubrobacteraceae bacterium]
MALTSQPSAGSYLMPSLEHATVADAMHPGIIACDPDLPVVEVARMMATKHVHCVAVIGVSHKDPACAVWGLISDLDLVRAAVERESGLTARELAGEPLVTVDPRTPLRQAAMIMLKQPASHLIVVEAETERPIGILSTLDVAGVLGWGEA